MGDRRGAWVEVGLAGQLGLVEGSVCIYVTVSGVVGRAFFRAGSSGCGYSFLSLLLWQSRGFGGARGLACACASGRIARHRRVFGSSVAT